MREADAMGFDNQTKRAMKEEECKVELIVQYLQSLTVDAQVSGVLTIAPPILTRVFQNFSNGLSAFYAASLITEVPYPFPYMQTTELLLLGHCIVTPIAMCSVTAVPIWSGVFWFLTSLILISLNQIAVELEDPYGQDINDLNLIELQQEMNKRLRMLHVHADHPIPILTKVVLRHRTLCCDPFTNFGSTISARGEGSFGSMGNPGFSSSGESAADAADAGDEFEGEGEEEDEQVADVQGGSDLGSGAEVDGTSSGGGGRRKRTRWFVRTPPASTVLVAQAVAPQNVAADLVPDDIRLISLGQCPVDNC
mmetsp:Transcript_74200/g.241294  ORF Transcript_74200/g.241294 Transcript_74200/m.241294 type:complete len:309 (+) Transcript_74200:563-1489(+)